jgi:hypothetical protein
MSEEEKIEFNEPIEEDIEIEFTTREEYIGCAFNAIMAVSDMDYGLLNKTGQERIKRIRRMCLRILDECVKEMHDELFENEEED